MPDDLVAVFYKHTCNFGFATHLFGSELKALYASDTVPRGVSFRISPTSHTDLSVFIFIFIFIVYYIEIFHLDFFTKFLFPIFVLV